MFGKKKAALLSVVVLLSSCSLIYLGDITIEVVPSFADSILEANETIRIVFSEEPEHSSFESIFKLTGPDGACEGDFEWSIDDQSQTSVVFSPLDDMQPGFRYRLKIKGDLDCVSGRVFSKDINIPFYYLTDALPPVLNSVTVNNADIVDVQTEIVFSFSKAVDSDSFDDAFSLNPSTDFDISWNAAGTAVTVSPTDKWLNLQYYRWSISTDLIDNEDIPIPKLESGSFLVQADTSAPELLSICPAADNGDGSFTLKTALGGEDLLSGEHLAITFSEEVDYNSLVRNFSINPSIDGYLLEYDTDTVLYYINESLPPDTEYELIINEGLEDTAGNSTADEISVSFIPLIPKLEITSVEIVDNSGSFMTLTNTDFNNDGYIDTPGLDLLGIDTLHFVLALSESYPEGRINQRQSFIDLISLSPVFPPGTITPTLYLSSWLTDNSIELIYEGLIACSVDEPVYYEFKINEGSEDSEAANGA
ncbi:MAG TPA: hypothetical protein DCO79_10005, partial [Spirochaeta sp.]|nr:hypothetical protein [Spirochaeta sp.]